MQETGQRRRFREERKYVSVFQAHVPYSQDSGSKCFMFLFWQLTIFLYKACYTAEWRQMRNTDVTAQKRDELQKYVFEDVQTDSSKRTAPDITSGAE